MKNFLDQVREEINSTIVLDFDGVIHLNSKGFHDGTIYDDPLPGTEEALKQLHKKYKIIIFTCKANPDRPLINGKTGIDLIWGWLNKHNLAQYISDITDKKPRASFYVDDKGIKFENWEQTLNDINFLGKNIKEDPSKF